MTKADSKGNKAFVLMAFDALFNKRDYKAAEAFWSPDYNPTQCQHPSRTQRTV